MGKPLVKNAVTRTICQSPADRYSNVFVCQANKNPLGDLNVGIFSDLTPPEPWREVDAVLQTAVKG